ncbi:MAG: DUF1073 domain-containing protein, partial [Thiobacillus sp.]
MIAGKFQSPKVDAPKLRPAIDKRILTKTKQKHEATQFEPYQPPAGVIPAHKRQEALAQDSTPYDYVNQNYVGNYFPGYQYLAMLAQMPEYRKISDTISRDMTRAWIEISSADKENETKIARIIEVMTEKKIQAKFKRAIALDIEFGRGQLYLDLKKPNGGIASEDAVELASPLAIDPAKIVKGSFIGLNVVEPMWTYPSGYNADNPLGSNFYKPLSWYVMGKTTNTSRLLTFVSRELPDILKPTYNFGGVSLFQLAQPYVNNFLRTRDSVSDVVHSFSTSGIKTNLSSTLTGVDDPFMMDRADTFNDMRDNRGLLMLDNDSEEFFQFNVPLGGLDSLQAQSQEQCASVMSMPLIVYLGMSPGGLNASSQGEIDIYHETIHAAQEHTMRDPLETVIKIIQLSEWGVIDKSITFTFNTLSRMDEVQSATARKTDAETAAVYVSVGAISPDEVRAKVAADPESGYNGLEDELEDGADENTS